MPLKVLIGLYFLLQTNNVNLLQEEEKTFEPLLHQIQVI